MYEKEISHWEFEGTGASSCGEEYRAAALLMAPIHCIMSGAFLVAEIEYKKEVLPLMLLAHCKAFWGESVLLKCRQHTYIYRHRYMYSIC